MKPDAGRAADVVLRAMAVRGWNLADLIRAAGVDRKTAASLLNGTSWPQVRTRAAIEDALLLPRDTLRQLAEGASVDVEALLDATRRQAKLTPSGEPAGEQAAVRPDVSDQPGSSSGSSALAVSGADHSPPVTDDEVLDFIGEMREKLNEMDDMRRRLNDMERRVRLNVQRGRVEDDLA